MTTQTTPPTENAEASDQPAVHTPGPWRHERQIHPYGIVYPAKVFAGNQEIACLAKTRSLGEASSNAQLMSAAPDMLKALRAAMNCIGEISSTMARAETMHMIQDAMKKATGTPDIEEVL